ncbi:MAG: CinA family protein [Rickettsiaceae bacterium H1]|nr:CinA family protein [Rickettsiaceae bacterium H1]
MLDNGILAKTKEHVALLMSYNIKVATAESCTGGLLAAYLTAIPGSSAIFDRAFVTYSNEAKTDLLGVSKTDIDRFGAVSGEVAAAMASGALKKSLSDLAIGITGIAGPGVEIKEKPIGLVYLGIAYKTVHVQKYNFTGERNEIRSSTVMAALNIIEKFLLS